MKKEIDKVKGSYDIFSNGKYVVLSGNKLYIFKPDGSLIACRKDLRYVGRITFLSGNRMLLCGSKSIIHVIDLHDGSDLWTVQGPKTEFNLAYFAVTPDETCAYTYDKWKGQFFIIRLELNTREIDSYDISFDIGATMDILCDSEGVPCVLKTLFENIGGKVVSQNGVRMQDYDILYRGSSYYWKTKWQFDGNRRAIGFLGSVDRVITNDLYMYEPSSGTLTDLLENEVTWKRNGESPQECWMDQSGSCLCLEYPSGNVVIDLSKHLVVAQYTGEFKRGCLIDEEYWICQNERICRKPFPRIEELQPIQTGGAVHWFDDFFAKNPELW